MSKREPIITYEFGTLYIEGQAHKEGDTPIGLSTFNNLWDFILSNRASDDVDVVMSVHTRSGKRYIKVGRYIGTIQTKNGQIIEVLPKVYKASGHQEEDVKVCRGIFLNMLKHFTDFSARSFQKASLNTKKDFPILEVYISNYINAVEIIVLGGLKKDYTKVSENQRYLKGRLNVSQQITKNSTNKALFSITHSRFIDNIPQNRIIVSTLQKLMKISHSTSNKSHITTLLTQLSDIPSSSNLDNDLRVSSVSNRLFSSYQLLMTWSRQFLQNKGFTSFSGAWVNQSLLFQAEKLFEQFIAYLFKKYVSTYPLKGLNTLSQNARYYLIDRHNGSGMFRLKPDIVVESDNDNTHYDCVIIDTKWKAIDSHSPKSNYLIDIKDMYQLYAYGQKYRQGESVRVGHEVLPKLVLLYPYSEKFIERLPDFIYEDILDKYGLKLMVVPFDLTDPKSYESQIHNIIRSLQVEANTQPVLLKYDFDSSSLPLVAAEDIVEYSSKSNSGMMLVGCFKDFAHKEWIMSNNLYNIRLGRRNGSIEKSGLMISASRLLLYNKDNPSEYRVYTLDTTKQILANNDIMRQKGYPQIKRNRSYILYVMGDEIKDFPPYDVIALRKAFTGDTKGNAPFYVEL